MELEVRDLSVRFGTRTLVHEVSFQIQSGEKVALVGESGSGKTLTALSLLRLVPDACVNGQVLWHAGDDAPRMDLLQLSERKLQAIRGREIGVIFQEPMTALNPLQSIGAQIAEVVELHLGATRRQAWSRAVELLQRMGIEQPEVKARHYPHQLSGGQRQRVMIAIALAGEPRMLIADEPTTALDVTVRQQILALLEEVQREHDMGLLMITHDLPMVQRFADRVIVMKDGRVVEQGATQEVFQSPQNVYTRQLIRSRPLRHVASEVPIASDKLAMDADDVSVNYAVPRAGWVGWWSAGQFNAVKGATLQLMPGQTLGIIGESGSGKTSLALAMLDLVPYEGVIQIHGQTWRHHLKQDRAIRRCIQVVFQDPFSSLSPRCTVEQLVGEGLSLYQPDLSEQQVRARVIELLADVGLTQAQFPGLLSRYPHSFSGGQRQRLALARALAVDPSTLVLDEPTSALDVTVQQQIIELLQRLQKERGLSYLLITHDMTVVHAIAHHVMVMKNGEVIEQGRALDVLMHPTQPYTRMLVDAAGVDQVLSDNLYHEDSR